MDSEPYKQRNNENQQSENSDPLLDGRNVLPTARIRCGSTDSNETNGFVLDYHTVFLPIITVVLWAVYVLT
jgi:hypothetical protein